MVATARVTARLPGLLLFGEGAQDMVSGIYAGRRPVDAHAETRKQLGPKRFDDRSHPLVAPEPPSDPAAAGPKADPGRSYTTSEVIGRNLILSA
jgi:hypothetical protein